MNLDQQIQILIDEAPDQTAAQAVQTVAPLLKGFAEQLKHPEYYILQNVQQGWVMTTLSNRKTEGQTKTVIYAYPSLDAAAAGVKNNPELMAMPYPVTHLLFQLLSLKQLDSLILLDDDGKQGVEVQRQILQTLLRQQLKQSQVPPDIA
ncbi:MAG: hypothetical protein AAF152_06045 [Cyanobacteria bacterium P01_A01_bin.114]